MAELTMAQKRALALASARARMQQAPAMAPEDASAMSAANAPGAQMGLPASMQSDDTDDGGRPGWDTLVRGINTGVLELGSLPVGAGLEAANLMGVDVPTTSGSDFIRSKLGPLGLTLEPGEEGMAANIGQGLGTAATLGAGGVAGLMNRGSQVLQRGALATPSAQGAGTRVVDELAAGVARNPRAVAAAETAAGGGEALGRTMAQDEYGEDSWQGVVGSLIGGITAGTVPSLAARGVASAGNIVADNMVLAGAARNATRRLFRLEEPTSVRERASQRMQEVTGGREGAVDALRDTETVDPTRLTPAQRVDDPGVLSVAARARADDPEMMAQWVQQTEQNLGALRDDLANVTGPEAERLRSRLGQDVRDAAVVAATRARQQVDEMGEGVTPSESSSTFVDELTKARNVVRDQRRAAWDQVPMSMTIPASTTRGQYMSELETLTPENANAMPDIARRFLDPESDQSYFAEGAGEVPLQRLQNLRSELMDVAREASSGANPNANRARIANSLARSILDDINAFQPGDTPGAEAFQTARALSRSEHEVFGQGPVEQVLRRSRSGQPATDPTLALERTIGSGGTRAQTALRDFDRALSNDNPVVNGAYRDFLRSDFVRRTGGPGGQFNPRGAEAFFRRYGELLQNRPELRSEFERAIQSGNVAGVASRIQDGAAAVLGRNNPAEEVRQIRRMSQSDETGAVWEDFREGLVDEIMSRAATRDPRSGVEGEFPSGAKLLSMLDAPKTGPALRAAFNETEFSNLRRIATTLRRIERDMESRPAADILTDNPSWLAQIGAQFAGAQLGGAVGGNTGSSLQMAGILSNQFRRLQAAGFRDPAKNLIISALGDSEKMQTLLTPMNTAQRSRQSHARLNAWVTEMIAESGAYEGMREEMDQNMRAPTARDMLTIEIEGRRGQRETIGEALRNTATGNFPGQ